MDIHAILVVLYWLFCKIQYAELAERSCPLSHYEHSGTCCKKCKAGTFVLTHCSKTTETVCEPCKHGTFSKDWTSLEECSRCDNRHCQPTMDLVQICNSTVDNQCGCIETDQFHHIPSDSCRECKSCPPGQYPVHPCTGETICARCPKNYFSNTRNYNKRCLKCTVCKKYNKTCSSIGDSICRYDVLTKTFFTTSQQKMFVHESLTPTLITGKWNSTASHSKKTTNNFVDPIIITVVFVIIISMIIIATLLYLRRNKAFSTHRSSIIQESKGMTFPFGGALLRHQPGEITLGLHALLNPEGPNNWRAVASEVGVPYLQILNFETDNIDTATKEMLHYWGTKNDATLDRLYQALRKLGRDDACTFLQGNVELECTETIV